MALDLEEIKKQFDKIFDSVSDEQLREWIDEHRAKKRPERVVPSSCNKMRFLNYVDKLEKYADYLEGQVKEAYEQGLREGSDCAPRITHF